MNQLSLRGFDDELRKKIRELAKSRGISLNKATLILLRKAAGLPEPGEGSGGVGSSLDHLIGAWSKKEEKEFLQSIEVFEKVDEALS